MMRTLFVTLLLAFIASPAIAAKITPADAAAHVGQTVTVEGAVSEVFTSRRSNTTFINMGGRYPDHIFSAVIFASDAGTFPNVRALEGKTIDDTGRIRLYRGKPEIILHSAGQIGSR